MEVPNDMNLELIADEIEVLKAIFCNEGEFILHTVMEPGSLATSDSDGICFTINLKCASIDSRGTNELQITITLTRDYPKIQPNVSLSSAYFKKKTLDTLRNELLEYAKILPEGPRILEMAMWLQGKISDIPNKQMKVEKIDSSARNLEKDEAQLVILKLDHMRNRTRYIKTISSWAQDFDISMILIFVHRLILLVFYGSVDKVREYLKRHKACPVDVDSSGKPCKEKMMNVIAQVPWKSAIGLTGVKVLECTSFDELEDKFSQMNLSTIYDKHIRTLLAVT